MSNYNKIKREEKQTCRGLAQDGSKCRYAVIDGNNCCLRSHSDMENYTEEQFNNLQLCKKCTRPRWRYLGDRNMCENCYQKHIQGLI